LTLGEDPPLLELLQATESTEMPPLSIQEQLMSFLMELNTLGMLQPSSDMEGSPAVLIMFQIVEKYHQASQPRPEEDHILIIMSTILWLGNSSHQPLGRAHF
jgi:hypothetical protein